MFDSVFTAAEYLTDGMNLLFLMLGVVVGIIFGIIPGLGGATAIALLLPLTFGMQAEQAITLMGGVMGAVTIGGSITAILLNTPGTAPNAATCFDGYPLTRQGKAGMAIGAAVTASSIGGVIGAFILILLLPVAKNIILYFGPPAYFMLAVLGLTALTAASSNLLRGLVGACLGLFIGFVGYDDMGGATRYAAGVDYLWDGLSIVPVLIGLFAIAEMLKLYVMGGSIAKTGETGNLGVSGTLEGIKAAFRHFKVILSGSAIGAVIGTVPGVGGTVASFLSYSFTLQTSKDKQNFGKGDIRGVIAPEASNNAKDGGSLIPTLAFGIPGSAEMALFLGVLILHGMDPGPMLLLEREFTIFVLILALLAATLVSGVIVLLTARYLIKVTFIDSAILIPSVIVVSLVGAYALHNSIGDVFAAAFFGVLGYLMHRFDYPRITLVIALVLGGLMERNYFQTSLMYRGDWSKAFGDTPFVILLVLAVLALLMPVISSVIKRKTRQSV
jgi:putative tricarboxylic transport membrane protein